MALDGTWDERRRLRWGVVDRAGWEYLLPPAAGSRWLCLDTTQGKTAALLASVCGALTAIAHAPADSPAMAELLSRLGLSVRVARWGDPALAQERFDGFVLHDLDGVLDRDAVDQAIGASKPLLAPGAFVYVALRNRFGYGRLQRGVRELAPDRARRYFRASDFGALAGSVARVHPLIADERGRVLDVIMPTGYVSAQNPSRRGERLRRVVLGPQLAPVLAPAFALVSGPPAGGSILDQAVRELERRRGVAPGRCSVRRYHCLRQGKVVVSAGPGQGDERFVLVFARDPVAIERRQREFALLERLGHLPPAISRHIPRAVYQDDVAGARLFVLQEFPGVTLEADVPTLEAATRGGADFLARFHLATAKRARMTVASFEALYGAIFDDARRRYPVLAEALAALRRALGTSLEGLELPTVWIHGDYKVENLVVDPSSGELAGVIDWEISEPEGLPLHDLWYLLLYNRYVRGALRAFPSVAELMDPARLPPHESALCARYVRALGLPAASIAPLAGAFLVHHCARRIFYSNDDKATMDRIRSEMEACTRTLGAASAAEAPHA